MNETQQDHSPVPIKVIDSITHLVSCLPSTIVVCGSHGGSVAVRYALAAGVSGVILNDAGIGKDAAGVRGLEDADEAGVAAATVSHHTSRIGDGRDTLERGVISAANVSAREAGVGVGQTAADALAKLANARVSLPARRPLPPFEPTRRILDANAQIVALDSASQIDSNMRCWVAVTGSHGGAVGGTAVKAPTKGVIFNDAGVGRDNAGISRLVLLEGAGIPAATVSHLTARIGEGVDTYENGVISFVNALAADTGVAPGDSAREATAALADTCNKPNERGLP